MIRYFKSIEITGKGVPYGINKNLYYWRNVVSPYAGIIPEFSKDEEVAYVDPCYGYSYNKDVIEHDVILYGDSAVVPERIEEIRNGGCSEWLRIPFVKIPRIRVHSAQELIDCLSYMKFYDRNLLFRGQTTEYFLNRPKELMRKLYGDSEAKEPSLVAYALRKKRNFVTVQNP